MNRLLFLCCSAAAAAGSSIVPPQLMTAEGFDNQGAPILVQPVDTNDEAVQTVLISPHADKFTLDLACTPGSHLVVQGRKAKAGQFTFTRDKTQHAQIIEVTCETGKGQDNGAQKYALLAMSDHYPSSEIPIPKLSVDTIGECTFENGKFSCPVANKKDEQTPPEEGESHEIRVVSHNDPTVKYLLRDSLLGRDIDIRLLDGRPTVPFKPKHSMLLIAESARTSESWPVSFGGSVIPTLLQGFGTLLAAILALLLITLLCVVGSASLCGVGVPLGATEIVSAFTMLMQYLCFSNYLRGTSKLESLVVPMKWVTMFMPAPTLELRMPASMEGESGAERAVNIGDISDIQGAWGAIFWSAVLMSGLVLIHGLVYAHFMRSGERYTFPHRAKFGNWESRLLNWLALPLTVACTIGLLHPRATTGTQIAGGILMVAMIAWIVSVGATIGNWVATNQVCWVWGKSTRESGRPTSDVDAWIGDGYWGDVTADQLVTQPVNRSIIPFFPYQWISTVADITPVTVAHSLIAEANQDMYAPHKMKRAHKAPTYPLAKAPQVVTIIKTREPTCCLGKRLVAGLLRTQWLDLLFTYEGLVKFFSDDHGNCEIPLVVKTDQLTGPKTHGANAFFFDGARVPFIRVAETIFKISIGMMIAMCSLDSFRSYHAILYALITVDALLMTVYTAASTPYTRILENYLMTGLYVAIGACAASFALCRIRDSDESCLTDALLIFVCLCTLLLSLYAALVIFAVFTALCCPPLNETRFLEKLSNCSVNVIDPSGEVGFEIPGYSKYAAHDLLAHAQAAASNQADSISHIESESRSRSSGRSSSSKPQPRIRVARCGVLEELALDFYHSELRQACQTGKLPIPH